MKDRTPWLLSAIGTENRKTQRMGFPPSPPLRYRACVRRHFCTGK